MSKDNDRIVPRAAAQFEEPATFKDGPEAESQLIICSANTYEDILLHGGRAAQQMTEHPQRKQSVGFVNLCVSSDEAGRVHMFVGTNIKPERIAMYLRTMANWYSMLYDKDN